MLSLHPGLHQSLLIQAQRRRLDKLGARIGTPVLYLKAAWADPVLYGGRGERVGSDIDVLVRPSAFAAFAQELQANGYRLHRDAWRVASHHLAGKAWLLDPPPDALPVDLHRNVADPPWFSITVDDWIDRAVAYPSIDGPILSLSPEDQVLYAAAHYANHRYSLGAQHLQDIKLLLRHHAVDWNLIKQRAHDGHLRLALVLLVESLRIEDTGLPRLDDDAFVAAWRLIYARRKLKMNHALRRSSKLSATDMAVLMPIISDRTTALSRYLIRSALLRPLDAAEVILHHVTTAISAQRRRTPAAE